MSETVKLIIEIPDYEYKQIKEVFEKSDVVLSTYSYIYHGTPLDDVKAEIREKSFNHYFEYGEYVGEDCRKERIIYLDQVLEILDNIGKGDKE